MITTKQRAELRAMANSIDTIFQIGKGGIGDALIKQVEDALRARELIKMRVLDNSLFSAKEAAQEISEKTGSDVVQVIGTKFVLYKKNEKEPDKSFQNEQYGDFRRDIQPRP